jgi:transcriptional regulator with XRE-family HTH domain
MCYIADMGKSDSQGRENPYRVYTAASIGPAIRHYRAEAGLTQSELADSVGLTPSYLSRLENGQETEQLRRIVAILKRLGVRITLQKANW